MGKRFAQIAFTPGVRAVQRNRNGADAFARLVEGEAGPDRLGPREAGFIARRDSFYMASVSETGWPYLQHRGGPEGFVRVLDDRTIGFADFAGNRQYVSVGNIFHDDRVALIMVDYPGRARLKLLGRARILDPGEPLVRDGLAVAGYGAVVERGILIEIEAFDWNCRQHITPRYPGRACHGAG